MISRIICKIIELGEALSVRITGLGKKLLGLCKVFVIFICIEMISVFLFRYLFK